MKNSRLRELDLPYFLTKHRAQNLIVTSEVLKNNPLGDPSIRHNYILEPVENSRDLPVIFHLSGYFSTGHDSFQQKVLSSNFVQRIDQGVEAGILTSALHVFVDANTFWGGSQFINSFGCGRYEDYILQELYPAVTSCFSLDKGGTACLMGGSSGGYGALSLLSAEESPFQTAVAVAPDSQFPISLLPDLFKAAPELTKFKNFNEIKSQLALGEMQNKKSFFNLANVIAMAHCYSPAYAFKNDFLQFPIDLYSGKINEALWAEWLQQDPICFLQKRAANLKGKKIYLDVGKYDDFSLQFGTRQLSQLLDSLNVKNEYSEFAGNHFGLTARKLLFLQQLKF